jgi:hypothetical protein
MLSRKLILYAAFAVLGTSPHLSIAAGVTVEGPVPGLKCMLLDDQDLQATVQSQLPPIRSAPSPDAPIIGYPSEIVLVRDPLQEQTGYVAIVRINGQPGWIEADHLQPWHAMNGRPGKCIPSLLSNGRVGTHIVQ